MITMTCKCGTTTMTFRRLNASDFPNGWETDCCVEAAKKAKALEAAKKEVVAEEQPRKKVAKSVKKRLDTQKATEAKGE